jgi:hypothetical protein
LNKMSFNVYMLHRGSRITVLFDVAFKAAIALSSVACILQVNK